MGQQKVNKATREHPIWSELIWLNQALRPGIPSGQESRASTLNPKVEGSIPARPMETSCTTDPFVAGVGNAGQRRINGRSMPCAP
jgi:hypothetical protein